MSKGMNDGQKDRTRKYLDQFKRISGGCVICQRKVADWVADPCEIDGNIALRVYGCCAGHAMVSNSDILLGEAVENLMPTLQDVVIANPVLMTVRYDDEGEKVKYASAKE